MEWDKRRRTKPGIAPVVLGHPPQVNDAYRGKARKASQLQTAQTVQRPISNNPVTNQMRCLAGTASVEDDRPPGSGPNLNESKASSPIGRRDFRFSRYRTAGRLEGASKNEISFPGGHGPCLPGFGVFPSHVDPVLPRGQGAGNRLKRVIPSARNAPLSPVQTAPGGLEARRVTARGRAKGIVPRGSFRTRRRFPLVPRHGPQGVQGFAPR